MQNQEIQIKPKGNGKKVVGGAILVIGVVLLAKQLGADLPNWLFSWPILLIIIGIVNGFKHQFRNSSWLILILIGALFLLERINPDLSVARYTWPVVLIGVGLWFLFSRKNFSKKFRDSNRFDGDCGPFYAKQASPNEAKTEAPVTEENKYQPAAEEFIDSVTVFGGSKKNVLSKNFKGGDVVSIMGGTEINFTHADINGEVTIEVVQIFGGTKIIVPPTWDVISEMAAVFGGIDDKRLLNQVLPNRSKVLLIKGTSIFGGIEIRNF